MRSRSRVATGATSALAVAIVLAGPLARAQEPPAAPPLPAPEPPAPAAFPTVTAKVRVLELTARAEARRDAPVLHTFQEGEPLCVSRDETEGFRRVVLLDGRVAFIASAGLALGADAGAAQSPPVKPLVTLAGGAATAAPEPQVTRIKDVDELVRRVSGDDQVWRMAHDLERQDAASQIVVMLGLGAGAGLMLWGVSTDSQDLRRPLVFTGATLALVGPIVGWLLMPKRSSVLPVTRAWNDRHPTERLELE